MSAKSTQGSKRQIYVPPNISVIRYRILSSGSPEKQLIKLVWPNLVFTREVRSICYCARFSVSQARRPVGVARESPREEKDI